MLYYIILDYITLYYYHIIFILYYIYITVYYIILYYNRLYSLILDKSRKVEFKPSPALPTFHKVGHSVSPANSIDR